MNTRDPLTEELVSAYFDGELSDDERRRVEQLLAQDGPEKQWLEEIRSLRRDFQQLPSRQLGADFTGRALMAARQAAAAAGRPLAAPAADQPVKSYGWLGWASALTALAAALLVTLTLINIWSDSPVDVVADRDAGEVAREVEAVPGQDAATPPPRLDPSPAPDEPPGPRPSVDAVATKRSPPVEMKDPSSEQAVPTDANVPRSDSRSPQMTDDAAPGGTGTGAKSGLVAPDPEPPAGNLAEAVGSGRLLMVFEIAMTQQGYDEGRFDQALLDQQIPFDATLTVDPKLEQTLLRSRFLAPPDEDEKKEAEHVRQMVYVVSRGGKIDQIWQAMRERDEHVLHVKADLAIWPADQTVFDEIRRVADAEWAARDADDQEFAGAQMPGQRTRAQRLLLPRSWKGVSARLGRVSMTPAWLGDRGAVDAGLPAPPAKRRPRPAPGQRLGEEDIVEVLFVITVQP